MNRIISLSNAQNIMSIENKEIKFVDLLNINDDDSLDYQSSSHFSNDDDYCKTDSNEKKEIKRRQRLTHLTLEEKTMRRKLKVSLMYKFIQIKIFFIIFLKF
jgi:hypothetical protein